MFLKRLMPAISLTLTFSFLSAQQPDLILPLGHTGTTTFAAYSNDGKKLITCSNDKTAKIWDTKTGKLLNDLRGHTKTVSKAIFSPDGKTVITISDDSKARIWDINTGKITLEIPDAEDICFSPDGDAFAVAFFSTQVIIFDWKTKEEISKIDCPKYVVMVQYSHDGKKLATVDYENAAEIYEVGTGRLLASFAAHRDDINSFEFTKDDKKVLTASSDSSVILWDAGTGDLLKRFRMNGKVKSAVFSPDNSVIAANTWDDGYVGDVVSGKLLTKIPDITADFTDRSFSPDSKYLLSGTSNQIQLRSAKGTIIKAWEPDVLSTRVAAFSKDGSEFVTAFSGYAKTWKTETGDLISEMRGHSTDVKLMSLSPDNSKLLVGSFGGYAKIWDLKTNTIVADLKGHTSSVVAGDFSKDGALAVTGSWDNTAIIWDVATGKALHTLEKVAMLSAATFSADGTRVICAYENGSIIIWDVATGNEISNHQAHEKAVVKASFSPDGKMVATVSDDNSVRLWNARTFKQLHTFTYNIVAVTASFSADSKRLLVSSADGIEVRDCVTGNQILSFDPGKINYYTAYINNEKWIATSSGYGPLGIWDAETGKEIAILDVEANYLITAIDLQAKKLIGVNNSEVSVFNMENLEKLVTMVAVDSTDYLVYDKYGRYDGSPNARKMIYFNCGDEIITLDQVKDQLWVPGLGERITKNEKINAVKLSELNICGLTPQILSKNTSTSQEYIITPRKGGLGETILFVNGIATKRYLPSALKKQNDKYLLSITNAEVEKYFVDGQANIIEVKAYTKDNDISSRGEMTVNTSRVRSLGIPNLHAVIIGVSDYKGEDLDLKFAAKDATDIGAAIQASASKLLGKDHVFLYNLNTGKDKLAMPEKNAIRQVFSDLAKTTNPNDIVLVFFAGHGTVQGENKQFYLLTAEASRATISPSTIQNIGISVAELTEWMKPDQIKAQKRILILDACNSGQAIAEILAARNDDNAEQVKQIDKLNEKAGLYVLAASAGDQSAYEMGRYGQGILTHALLRSIKEKPEILIKGKYLNVSNWFNAAMDLVYDLVRENNINQQPQLITTTSFDLGIVDNEVLAGIKLPEEKAVFTNSNFQNSDESVMDDDLELSKLLNAALNKLANSSGSAISFSQSGSYNAWTLTGRYQISGNEVTVRANLKQANEVKFRFELKGKRSDLTALAEQMIEKAMDLLK